MSPLRKNYQTLNCIEISTQALKNNYACFQNFNPQAQIAPVLKSNAYGHGLKLVGKWIDHNLPVPFICVDSLYEAYELHKVKVKTPILIIGYTFPENFKIWKRLKNFSFPVFDEATLATLNQHQPGTKIHLKIDTGMHRLGIQPNRVGEWCKLLKRHNRIEIEGIYSHLSQADDSLRADFTRQQINTFKKVIHQFESKGIHFKWKHLAATAAATPHIDCHSGVPLQQDDRTQSEFETATLSKSIKALHTLRTSIPNPNHIIDPEFNLIRLGLGFYGYLPATASDSRNGRSGSLCEVAEAKEGSPLDPQPSTLLPALTLKSHIIQIKKVGKGSQISYGGTFVAKKPMRLGILPIGYYDGLNRRLSNSGKVLIRVGEGSHLRARQQPSHRISPSNEPNHKTSFSTLNSFIPSLSEGQLSTLSGGVGILCDIIGRVCMNVTIIDLTKVPEARVGDEVIIFSACSKHPNSIENTAKLCDTIPYEILVKLAESTKRTLV